VSGRKGSRKQTRDSFIASYDERSRRNLSWEEDVDKGVRGNFRIKGKTVFLRGRAVSTKLWIMDEEKKRGRRRKRILRKYWMP